MFPSSFWKFQPSHLLSHDRVFVCTGQRIESLRNLRILVLSFNEIQRMDGIGELVYLERLELGFNCIKSIEGIKVGITDNHLQLRECRVVTVPRFVRIGTPATPTSQIIPVMYCGNLLSALLHWLVVPSTRGTEIT